MTISILSSQLVHGVRVRYTELDAQFLGLFWPENPIGLLPECTLMAHNANKVGFRVHKRGDKMTCSLLSNFIGFEASEDSEVRDYILTTNLDDDSCSATRNVTHLLSKPCDPEIGDCALLEHIADYCRLVGPEIADCVLVSCPAGEERVDVKKGKRLCCPVGEKLAEERDGKAICCPPEKELKDVVDGKPVCCAPEENYSQGACVRITEEVKAFQFSMAQSD
uniref:EB domain-containing protein n=1 Tax=Steinernema glaseri TaxID=37863 RepID=A0A1I7ZBU7_9BILA